jgi:hypothetical protein
MENFLKNCPSSALAAILALADETGYAGPLIAAHLSVSNSEFYPTTRLR